MNHDTNHKPARVLCVEDEDDFRETIAEFLELEQYEVLQARNGREAMAIIQQTPPDIVLCDIRMPEMDGLTLLETVRNEPNCHVSPNAFVFLSAYAEPENLKTAYALDCEDVLAKPISHEVLAAKLDSKRARVFRARAQSACSRTEVRLLADLVSDHISTNFTHMCQSAEIIYSNPENAELIHLVELLSLQAAEGGDLCHLLEVALRLRENEFEIGWLKVDRQSFLYEVYSSAFGSLDYHPGCDIGCAPIWVEGSLHHLLLCHFLRLTLKYRSKTASCWLHRDAGNEWLMMGVVPIENTNQMEWYTPDEAMVESNFWALHYGPMLMLATAMQHRLGQTLLLGGDESNPVICLELQQSHPLGGESH